MLDSTAASSQAVTDAGTPEGSPTLSQIGLTAIRWSLLNDKMVATQGCDADPPLGRMIRSAFEFWIAHGRGEASQTGLGEGASRMLATEMLATSQT